MPRPVRDPGHHTPPGIDDQRIAERIARSAAGRIAADLRCRCHIALGLDRPRPEQHLPVILAGLQREGCGQHDQLRPPFAQRQEQLGKAQIVADREPDPHPVEIDRHDVTAGLGVVALAIGVAIGGDDVEEVDLAIARHLLALADRRRPWCWRAAPRPRSSKKLPPWILTPCSRARPCSMAVGLAARDRLGRRPPARITAAQDGEGLGQADEIRPLGLDRLFDQPPWRPRGSPACPAPSSSG
jgi:hypothetical protein